MTDEARTEETRLRLARASRIARLVRTVEELKTRTAVVEAQLAQVQAELMHGCA